MNAKVEKLPEGSEQNDEDDDSSSGSEMGTVHLAIDGPIATITNDNPDKHNAFDDAMDVALFDALAQIAARADAPLGRAARHFLEALGVKLQKS